MVLWQRLMIGLLGLVLLSSSDRPALAQTSSPDPASTPDSEVLESPAPNEVPSVPTENLQNYTLPQSFSLQIPQDWNADGTEAEGRATITNYSPDRPEGDVPQSTDIKTEVILVSEPPNEFVDREIATIISQEYPVRRYTTVEVNERTALRLWVSDLPQAYANQIITFVGYGSEGTAKIVTSYNTQSPEIDFQIEQVHDSFERMF